MELELIWKTEVDWKYLNKTNWYFTSEWGNETNKDLLVTIDGISYQSWFPQLQSWREGEKLPGYITVIDANNNNQYTFEAPYYPYELLDAHDNGSIYMAQINNFAGLDYSQSVTKYSAIGEKLWEKALVGNGTNALPGGLVSIPDGSFYYGGSLYGSFKGELSNGGLDNFLAKYNNFGDLLWARQIGTENDDWTYSISVDSGGSVYIGGSRIATKDDSNFDSYKSNRLPYIAKFSSEGQLLWETKTIVEKSAENFSLTTSIDGSIYVTGTADGYNPISQEYFYNQLFVSKYLTSGEIVWTKIIGKDIRGGGTNIVKSSGDNIFLAAFDTLYQLDKNGEVIQSKKVGIAPTTYIEDIELGKDGSIYISLNAVNRIGQPKIDAGLFIAKYGFSNGSAALGIIISNGNFEEGVTLTAPVVTGDPDGDALNPNYSYQWFKGSTAISGATASTYAVSASGAGTYKVAVTYTDAKGFIATLDSPEQVVSAFNNGTGTPASITDNGAYQEDATLTAPVVTADPELVFPDQDIVTGITILDSTTGATQVTGNDGIIDRFVLQTNSAPSTPFKITAFNPTEDILQIPQELASGIAQRTFFGVAKVVVPDRTLTKREQRSFRKQQKAVSKSVKRIGRTGDGFAYNQLTGELFVDTNGRKKGFGVGGGLLAVLEDTPAIGIDNFQFL